MHTVETCANLGCHHPDAQPGKFHTCLCEGQPQACPKCGRESSPWPLKRANLCSPPDWAKCIRPQPNLT